jgi:hypothetical protein
MDWQTWLKGLCSAVISGAANAVTGVVVAPETFNFQEGLHKLGALVGVGAVIGLAGYLKQSPLPQ